MEKEIETLRKEIYGNGSDGIKDRVGKLEIMEGEHKKTFEEIRKSLEANATVVSGLLKYQTEDQLRNELENERLKEKRANRRFNIVQTIAIAGLIITVLIYLFTTHV